LIGNKIMNRPLSYPGKRDEKNLGLTSLEESAEANSDGGPDKVGLVGGATASGKVGAVNMIGK
jgi:hypothetical protein